MSLILYPKNSGSKSFSELKRPTRKVRFATIGGGPGAFIGEHHLRAIQSLSTHCKLVAAAPSRNMEKSSIFAELFGLPAERVYADWKDMLVCEDKREDRPDVVIILTETHFHPAMAIAALNAGFHVVTDKPAAETLRDACAMVATAKAANKRLLTTYNHNLYAAVIHGRSLVFQGRIGFPHTALVRFPQSWGLHGPSFKQAWRFNRERCCGTDIATHAERLAAFWLPGYTLRSVSGCCRTLYQGRAGDDAVDATLIYRYKDEAPTAPHEVRPDVRVTLMAGEMCAGHEDALSIELFGMKGSLRWNHTIPYQLTASLEGKETRFVDGRDFQTPASFNPPEHPTGFADSWMATYMGIIGRIMDAEHLMSTSNQPEQLTVPVCGEEETLQSMAFVDALYRSSKEGGTPVDPQALFA